jgi:hypothetical protein
MFGKKIVKLKQAKEFLKLQKLFGETKENLIQKYAATYNTNLLQACVNLDEFQLSVSQDFLNYISNDPNRNLDEFNESMTRVKNYLDKFYENLLS